MVENKFRCHLLGMPLQKNPFLFSNIKYVCQLHHKQQLSTIISKWKILMVFHRHQVLFKAI